jgi:predicted ArsR family transcriptional regulator
MPKAMQQLILDQYEHADPQYKYLLQVLASQARPMTADELAAVSGISKATVQRIMGGHEWWGLVTATYALSTGSPARMAKLIEAMPRLKRKRGRCC